MLKIVNLTKKFRRREAVKGVSLHLEQGCYGLLGPNGAGKTTLIRCILGLYTKDSGDIIFSNDKIKCSYLPQKFGAFQEMSVYDVMYYFATVKKIAKKDRKGEIEKALELVNLNDRQKDRMGKLSGGMQRRVGIAQAVLGDPDIIFLDEPTAGLDPEERTRFRSIISKLRGDKIIVISTHIVEDVESVCDQVIIMNNGEIVENAVVADVCKKAEGKVYECRESGAKINEPYYIEKSFTRDGEQWIRYLSAEEQVDGEKKEPNLLDGYFFSVNEVDIK
ncbi:MAG: ATP-binding cassette domain-containing protein [Eubacterium sp.]|nr:ATP-binding cassette domain-containing protein [Eubacterium sp.]